MAGAGVPLWMRAGRAHAAVAASRIRPRAPEGALREPSADPAVVTELAGQVAGLAPTARAMGMFGEPVAVAEGAPEFERLLGVTGRDPGWKA
ncbi:hypothetical protein ACGFZQ_46615 [Streptomyces sp. NPDC048254]|uniref:hypothetical protein n=1 Tax=Streptomyces sp. NPDC048254 TaxID=3365525 RepID=UPI0037209F8D